ncbi:Hsp20 family protein [Ramlibacter albus]|uniref:Hsp20 family protein n=1 Tax=Ramlibacter albus TaxID=2079448 RepID=A0A923MA91_9BURK|nr:Hsp20 family protein [Ramlibacter albus]MBC5767172.1 Hsp20 family protein [Ramlibacter albus]
MFFAPAITTRGFVPATRAFDRNFERFVNDVFAAPAYRSFNVTQDDKAWTVTLDLPGVSREELDLQVEGAVVRIATKEGAKRQFKAAYELADEIDADATEATLENGVLTLKLAKKVPVSNARTIAIR